MSFDDKDPMEIIKTQREEIEELHKVINSQNIQKLSHIEQSDTSFDEETTKLEIFNTTYCSTYVICSISKHTNSDFIYINFISVDKPNLSIAMTEKSYVKLARAVDAFRLKYANDKQSEK